MEYLDFIMRSIHSHTAKTPDSSKISDPINLETNKNEFNIKNATITQEINKQIPDELRRVANDLCSIDGSIKSCDNIIATNGDIVVYLLSLSYNRLIKWENTMNERITFDNTYIRKQIDDVVSDKLDANQLIQDIINMGIYQIKFSSWTRKSNIIEMFMKVYPINPTSTGGKTYKTNVRGFFNPMIPSETKDV